MYFKLFNIGFEKYKKSWLQGAKFRLKRYKWYFEIFEWEETLILSLYGWGI